MGTQHGVKGWTVVPGGGDDALNVIGAQTRNRFGHDGDCRSRLLTTGTLETSGAVDRVPVLIRIAGMQAV